MMDDRGDKLTDWPGIVAELARLREVERLARAVVKEWNKPSEDPLRISFDMDGALGKLRAALGVE